MQQEAQKVDLVAVKSRAKAIFCATYKYPSIPFRSIGRPCFAWAMQLARFELINGTDAERDERAAQKIAEGYRFNIDQLEFQVQRRSFGSYTTTPDGAPEVRAIYARALQIARDHHRAQKAVA